jgi:hypothetical protein
MPGWVWPDEPEERAVAGSSGEPVASDPSETGDPLLAELMSRMARVVSIAEAGNRWRDDDKLANLTVWVVGSDSDARETMAALNAFSRGWGERSGQITTDEQVDGLGDEGWHLLTVGQGNQVTYHWRRDNLVVEAHIHCFGSCPGDLSTVDAATRGWVDAIDEAAR